LARGATIYAEVLGGNKGGQRGLEQWQPQIRLQYKSAYKMLENAGVGATEIDTINIWLLQQKIV
jgi:hypothetical protein